MKKHIANLVTCSRIVFSLPLLFIPLSSAWFYIFYLFCGFTDLVDGTIARKTGAVSKFGARLDTVADLVLMIVCCVRILPRVYLPAWLWVWVALIALIKMLNIALVLICKRGLIAIHSVFNKATGVALFLLPLLLTVVKPADGIAAICVLATVAAVQEVWLIAKGHEVL